MFQLLHNIVQALHADISCLDCAQPSLQGAIDAIRQGVFGDAGVFQPLLSSLIDGKDYYCISDEYVDPLSLPGHIKTAQKLTSDRR